MSQVVLPEIYVERVVSEAVRELRHRVLWQHKESSEACVIDIDDAEHAIHLAAFTKNQFPWGIRLHGHPGTLVGACSLFDQHCMRVQVPWGPGDDLRLRVMGTLPEARGWGAGAALIARALQEVQKQGRHALWCDARQVAYGFYERQGFAFLNDTYEIPDIGPHRTMAVDLSSRPVSNH